MKLVNQVITTLSVMSLLCLSSLYGDAGSLLARGEAAHQNIQRVGHEYDRGRINPVENRGAYNRGMEAGEAVGGSASGGVVYPYAPPPPTPQTVVQPIQYVPTPAPTAPPK